MSAFLQAKVRFSRMIREKASFPLLFLLTLLFLNGTEQPVDKAHMRVYIHNMGDDEFEDDLAAYLEGLAYPNLEMADVEIVWVRGNPLFGSDHIAAHNVREKEVEEVLFEIPPEVEARQHPDDPGKTIFWGSTREGRWLFVSCEDWTEGGIRYLKPITAFEPDEGREYWRAQ